MDTELKIRQETGADFTIPGVGKTKIPRDWLERADRRAVLALLPEYYPTTVMDIGNAMVQVSPFSTKEGPAMAPRPRPPPRPRLRPHSHARVLEPMTEDDAIAEFLKYHPNCRATKEQILEFLHLVRTAALNSIDLTSVVRAGFLAHVLPYPAHPGMGRVLSGTEFHPRTVGVRGKRATVVMPSLLWAIASRECAALPALNAVLKDFLEHKLGEEVPLPTGHLPRDKDNITPKQMQARNKALTIFFSLHPACTEKQKEIREYMFDLLQLIDSHFLSGTDIEALLNTFSLQGFLPREWDPQLRRHYRIAGLTFTPVTVGARGTQRDVVKYSLLWALLEQYCNDIDKIVLHMRNMVEGRVRDNILARIEQAAGGGKAKEA